MNIDELDELIFWNLSFGISKKDTMKQIKKDNIKIIYQSEY